MTRHTPTRKPPRRRDVGIVRLAKQLTDTAPEIELAWSIILDERKAAGWPTRTPEGDRKPHTGPPAENPGSLDYADPTGDQACHLERLDVDLFRLQDIHLELAKLAQEAHNIARRHLTVAAPALPACSHATCSEPVEHRVLASGGVSYVGMEQIAGQWVAKPGCSPVCQKHRRRHSRVA